MSSAHPTEWPLNHVYGAVIKRVRELLELEYVQAIRRGVVDPVQELVVEYEDDGVRVSAKRARERSEVVAALAPSSKLSSQAVANPTVDDGPRIMTIVMATEKGILVAEEPAPEL